MSFLDELPHDYRDLIVSLPYRVGLWVSECDDAGGDEADEHEKQALENIINGFTQDVFGSEVVQYIMSSTWDRRESWAQWSDDLEDIPAQCERALSTLNDVVDAKEVSAFKLRLLEIAEAVALAFREKEHNFLERSIMLFSYHSYKRHAKKVGRPEKSFEQFLNISVKERQTLCLLAAALGKNYV